MKKDEDYYMHHFKTEWCPLTKEHNKAMCEYAHNWHDFRRKTQIFLYDCELCPRWQPGEFISKYNE